MSHRVQQIVDKVQTILEAHVLTAAEASIYQHRTLSLSEPDLEIPAISITLGDDPPIDDDGATNFNYFDSLQSLLFRIVVKGGAQDEERHVIAKLLDLRRALHVALMVDDSLGLAFVIGVRYGGAEAPELSAEDEKTVGAMACRWLVHYRVNIADPQ